MPKDQAPATIPIRRLYLLALIDATKHPQIHGHPTISQTALQIAPVLTKEMMASPTISLPMMSLMQTLAKDDSADMSAPRAALLKRLGEVARAEWLAVLRNRRKVFAPQRVRERGDSELEWLSLRSPKLGGVYSSSGLPRHTQRRNLGATGGAVGRGVENLSR